MSIDARLLPPPVARVSPTPSREPSREGCEPSHGIFPLRETFVKSRRHRLLLSNFWTEFNSPKEISFLCHLVFLNFSFFIRSEKSLKKKNQKKKQMKMAV